MTYAVKRAASPRTSILKLLICLVLGIALCGGVGFKFWQSQHIVPTTSDGCPSDGHLSAHTVILLDATDALTPLQVRRFKEVVSQERLQLPRYGKMTVLLLDGTKPYDLPEVTSLCSPVPPKDVNGLVQNPVTVQANWDAHFAKPLDAITAKLETLPTAPHSPILEGLASLAWRGSDFSASVPRRRIVLISDLVENTSELSVFKPASLKAFPNSDLDRKLRINLKDVDVRLVVLQRPNYLLKQSELALPFFRTWLSLQHANVLVDDNGSFADIPPADKTRG